MGSFSKCLTDVLSLSQAMATEDLTVNLDMDLQEAVQQSVSEVGLSLKPKQMEAIVNFC